MSRKFNFNPGPSTLPLPVLEQVRDEFVEFHDEGMSIVEMSHRAKSYDAVHNECIALFKELMQVPDTHKIILLGGGATLQFSMVPMNLMYDGRSCDFTLTGAWATAAHKDAGKFGQVDVVFDGSSSNYMALTDPSRVKPNPGSAYLHVTSNETIQGTQWKGWPETGAVPLVADMSSDILSRRVPVEKFGILYAGAQKNLGPAGVTVVVIREDVLAACNKNLPAYLSYATHVKKNSLYNTPPVFAIYMMKLVFEWAKSVGGMDTIAGWAHQRASAIYDVIDAHPEFFRCPVAKESRSEMNVVFRLPTEELEKLFVSESAAQGFHGLKGHRSVGGLRASIYNAMPVEGAIGLAQFMKEFIATHG
ncbi:MAG: 3-phosphoserine/phosphohydroxythreonine transaminase [Bradymonadales bacterium]|nr:3-phosphoserine/phosphohydroxythreonine transaminase [Bradymonadales bacterium]